MMSGCTAQYFTADNLFLPTASENRNTSITNSYCVDETETSGQLESQGATKKTDDFEPALDEGPPGVNPLPAPESSKLCTVGERPPVVTQPSDQLDTSNTVSNHTLSNPSLTIQKSRSGQSVSHVSEQLVNNNNQPVHVNIINRLLSTDVAKHFENVQYWNLLNFAFLFLGIANFLKLINGRTVLSIAESIIDPHERATVYLKKRYLLHKHENRLDAGFHMIWAIVLLGALFFTPPIEFTISLWVALGGAIFIAVVLPSFVYIAMRRPVLDDADNIMQPHVVAKYKSVPRFTFVSSGRLGRILLYLVGLCSMIFPFGGQNEPSSTKATAQAPQEAISTIAFFEMIKRMRKGRRFRWLSWGTLFLFAPFIWTYVLLWIVGILRLFDVTFLGFLSLVWAMYSISSVMRLLLRINRAIEDVKIEPHMPPALIGRFEKIQDQVFDLGPKTVDWLMQLIIGLGLISYLTFLQVF